MKKALCSVMSDASIVIKDSATEGTKFSAAEGTKSIWLDKNVYNFYII